MLARSVLRTCITTQSRGLVMREPIGSNVEPPSRVDRYRKLLQDATDGDPELREWVRKSMPGRINTDTESTLNAIASKQRWVSMAKNSALAVALYVTGTSDQLFIPVGSILDTLTLWLLSAAYCGFRYRETTRPWRRLKAISSELDRVVVPSRLEL